MSASALGLGLVAAALLLYLAYSQSVLVAPRFAAAVRPLLGWPRRIALIAGVLLALVGLAQNQDGGSVAAGLVVALGLRHATRRQWAFGLRPRHGALSPTQAAGGTPVVTLPTGESFAVHWIHEARLVRFGDVLLVGCALAGSVAAFRLPQSPVLVLFPLDVGFAIGARVRWSGATGTSLQRGPHLEQVDLRWETAATAQHLLGPGVLAPPKVRRVRIPGAQDADPTDVGLVSGGRWSTDVHDPESSPPRRYLARWAARQSKLPGS